MPTSWPQTCKWLSLEKADEEIPREWVDPKSNKCPTGIRGDIHMWARPWEVRGNGVM